MRIEIPTCQRCCLCLPLRYGLLAWGYLRLMLAGLILLGTSFNLHFILHEENDEKHQYHSSKSDIAVLSIVIIIVAADIVLGSIFIISCHKKNVKWMSKYYHYTLVLLALFIPLSFYSFCTTIYFIHTTKPPFSFIFTFVLLDLFSLFAYNVIQIYYSLLIRSEIIKLKNNCEFRFENIAAEAESSLRIKNSIGQPEEEEEDKRRQTTVA